MVTIERGDIVLCDLNPVIGSEQSGIQPSIIVQINRANAASPHSIIAPLTTKIKRALLPSHVFIPAGTDFCSAIVNIQPKRRTIFFSFI